MSSRSTADRIRDIIAAIDEISVFLVGLDQAAFCADAKTIKAVQLNFIVIGEAATRIPDEVQRQFPNIPWPLMRAMRNRLVHVYFQVDPRIVWETAVGDLPPLVDELRAAAMQLEQSPIVSDEDSHTEAPHADQ